MTHKHLRCGAVCGALWRGEGRLRHKGGSAPILWRSPTVRSRFVAQFVAQPLWRKGPQPIGPIILRILARCSAPQHDA
jgi:hypothetical protein